VSGECQVPKVPDPNPNCVSCLFGQLDWTDSTLQCCEHAEVRQSLVLVAASSMYSDTRSPFPGRFRDSVPQSVAWRSCCHLANTGRLARRRASRSFVRPFVRSAGRAAVSARVSFLFSARCRHFVTQCAVKPSQTPCSVLFRGRRTR